MMRIMKTVFAPASLAPASLVAASLSAVLVALSLALPPTLAAQAPQEDEAAAGILEAGTPEGFPAAQEEPPRGDSLQLVDRVAAIVGDTAILLSEVRQEFVRLQAQGVEIPPQGTEAFDALTERMLAAMVDRYVLLIQAQREGIRVTDDELDRLTEERFQEIRRNFDSQEAFQRAVEESGQNMFQYRQMLQAEARAEILLQRYRGMLQGGGRMPPATVSEEEIQAYFEEVAAAETRPASASFHRLVVIPRPTQAAEDSALAIAQRALEEIREGEEFAVVARRYSEDRGTREQGGELGWLRRGELVPAFGDAAWAARPGVAVGPVRTRFGYHIIRVENVRGGERNLRHILVRPAADEEQVEGARALAEALADSVRAGVDARELAERHQEWVEEDVRFEDMPVNQISSRFGPSYLNRIQGAIPGEVVGPFRVDGEMELPNYVVIELLGYRPAGRYELDDLREMIRERLRAEKQLDRYLEELRENTFVQILL